MASYRRQHGLDQSVLNSATAAFERALGGRQYLTRTELGDRLGGTGGKGRTGRKGGKGWKGIRLALISIYAELEGVICSGPRRGKQLTYALLAERAPGASRLSRDEALAELTRRYFTSHGPATIRDFVWWSGLTTADTTRDLELNRARHEVVDGRTYWRFGGQGNMVPGSTVHLLPVYDEYLVAYRDREAVPHGPGVIGSRSPSESRRVTFHHALVIGGQIAGTWKTARRASGQLVDVIPLRRLTAPERRALAEAAARYGRFLDLPVSLSIA